MHVTAAAQVWLLSCILVVLFTLWGEFTDLRGKGSSHKTAADIGEDLLQ